MQEHRIQIDTENTNSEKERLMGQDLSKRERREADMRIYFKEIKEKLCCGSDLFFHADDQFSVL